MYISKKKIRNGEERMNGMEGMIESSEWNGDYPEYQWLINYAGFYIHL